MSLFQKIRSNLRGDPLFRRKLLKLRQLSLREAADESGMSIGALKVAGHRALKALRAKLIAHED